MDLSNDYIAFEYIGNFQRIKDVLPYQQYTSGAKIEDNTIYLDNSFENTNPILRLDFDILNKDGFGIKKGFYEIRPDDDYTCLMFIQAGKINAKIPVIKTEQISKFGNDYEWLDKKKNKNSLNTTPTMVSNVNNIASPKKIQPVLTNKQKKKRDRRYKKGIDPLQYIHSEAKIKFDDELNLYVVIWEKYNLRVIGVLKLK